MLKNYLVLEQQIHVAFFFKYVDLTKSKSDYLLLPFSCSTDQLQLLQMLQMGPKLLYLAYENRISM